MSTAPAARQAAKQYIQNGLSGQIAELNFKGMEMTPNGRLLGYEVEWDRGTSIAGAVFSGLLAGLITLLLALFLGAGLVLVGVPPSLLILLGVVVTGASVVSGARSGADASETERLTVTVDNAGNIVLVNRDLSPEVFANSLGRDDLPVEPESVIGQISKHVVFHKLLDHYLDSRKSNK